MIQFKCLKKSKGFSTTNDAPLVLLFVVISGIFIYFYFNYIRHENQYNHIIKNSSIIKINEEFIELHSNNTEFSYGFTQSYAIFAPQEFLNRCLKNKSSNSKFEDLSNLSLMTLEAYEVNENTKIIKYNTPEYANLKCINFEYKDNSLLYKGKPVYFLIKRVQE